MKELKEWVKQLTVPEIVIIVVILAMVFTIGVGFVRGLNA